MCGGGLDVCFSLVLMIGMYIPPSSSLPAYLCVRIVRAMERSKYIITIDSTHSRPMVLELAG